MGRSLAWSDWQRFAGWAAVLACLAWFSKFVLYSAIGGYQETAYAILTGPLPTIALIAGLIALLGIAAPLVADRGRVVRVVASVGGLIAASLVLGAIQNTVQGWPVIVATDDPINAQNMFGAVYSLVIAYWLLRPRTIPAAAVLAAVGGLSWTVNAVMVARDGLIEGWAVVFYQVGLFALLLAGAWVAAALIRAGRYLAVIGGVLLVIVVLSLPNLVPVGDNAWIAIMGLVAVALAARTLLVRDWAQQT